MTQIYQPLVIPYANRQIAKQNKCRWDINNKQWTISNENENYEHMCGMYLPVELNVPFEEKEEAKAMGAVWDPNKKCWVIPKHLLFQCQKWLRA